MKGFPVPARVWGRLRRRVFGLGASFSLSRAFLRVWLRFQCFRATLKSTSSVGAASTRPWGQIREPGISNFELWSKRRANFCPLPRFSTEYPRRSAIMPGRWGVELTGAFASSAPGESRFGRWHGRFRYGRICILLLIRRCAESGLWPRLRVCCAGWLQGGGRNLGGTRGAGNLEDGCGRALRPL